MRSFSLLLAVLVLSPAAREAGPQNQTAAEMQGGCGDYKANLHAELKVISGQVTRVAAGSRTAKAPQIRPRVPYSVLLLPQEKVQFALPPGQNRNAVGRSAGILSLGNLAAGNWRISTDNPLWIDFVASGHIVGSSAFEMKTGCTAILKTVVFAQRAKTRVLIQLNGATRPSVRLLVTPVVGSSAR